MEKSDADDTSGKPHKKHKQHKQRTVWTDEKEDLLLSIWEDHANDLKNRKNSHVYKMMEKVFHENHFDDINFCEIKTKIRNLLSHYKMEKDKCGGSPSQWKLYDRVHKIKGASLMRDLHEKVDESYIFEDGSSMDLSQDLTQASTTDLTNSDSCLIDVPDAAANVADDTSEEPNKKRKQRTVWTDEKEDLLLSIWEEHANDLKHRNTSHVYKMMEQVFHENHFDDINVFEIKKKITNLSSHYKTEKAKYGGSRSEWKLYDRVHKIRGARPMRDFYEKVEQSYIFEDLFPDSSLIDVPNAAANVVVPASIEFIDEESSSKPAKKKMKVQSENPTLIIKDFATKMLKIEADRTERLKEIAVLERERNQILKKKQETMQEKNNILAKKNELAEERNELLRKILEK